MLRTRSLAFALLALHPDGDPSGGGLAVAEPPVTPAAAAPVVAAPEAPKVEAEDNRTPIQKALAVAKEAAAKGEIAFTTEAAPDPAASGDPPSPKPAEGAGTETPPAAAAGTDGEGEGVDEALLTVELPVRKGAEPLSIKVADKEAAEAIRHLKNNYLKGEQLRTGRAEVEQGRQELAYFQELAEVDPVGLVLEHMNPESHLAVARHLLTSPGVAAALVEILSKWEGAPDIQRAETAEMERDYEKQKGTIRERLTAKAQAREVGSYTKEMVDRLSTLVPAEHVETFIDDALKQLSEYYEANRLRGKLPAERFTVALQNRLRLFGITPEKALVALSGQPASTPSTPTHARPTGTAAEELAAKAKGAPAVNGQRLVEAARVRQSVVTSAPGTGAGVTANGATPPAKQGILERIKWAKANWASPRPQ